MNNIRGFMIFVLISLIILIGVSLILNLYNYQDEKNPPELSSSIIPQLEATSYVSLTEFDANFSQDIDENKLYGKWFAIYEESNGFKGTITEFSIEFGKNNTYTKDTSGDIETGCYELESYHIKLYRDCDKENNMSPRSLPAKFLSDDLLILYPELPKYVRYVKISE